MGRERSRIFEILKGLGIVIHFDYSLLLNIVGLADSCQLKMYDQAKVLFIF